MKPHAHSLRTTGLAALALAAGLALASLAFAAERATPKASGPAKQPPPAAPMPNLPENAEEIGALKGENPAAPTVTRRPAKQLTPMMAEILAYIEARDLAMATKMQQQKLAKTDAAGALAAQAELQAMKQETELEVLRIQVRWARKDGRNDDAAKLEATIDQILNPKVPVATEKRPAPTSSTSPTSR